MAVQKKKRAHRVSKGLRKHSKHPLTEVQKVLAGKGLLADADKRKAEGER
jgi:hypothetical protein